MWPGHKNESAEEWHPRASSTIPIIVVPPEPPQKPSLISRIRTYIRSLFRK